MDSRPTFKPSWWKRRTSLEKALFLFLFLLFAVAVITLAVAAAVMCLSGAFSPADDSQTSNLCLTPDCIKTAARMLESIDNSIDPCEDFFEYACGTWNRLNAIPDDTPNYSTFRKLDDQLQATLKDLLEKPLKSDDIVAIKYAKNLYQSCLDTSIIEERQDVPLQALLQDLKGWPVLEPNWTSKGFDLADLLGKLKLYNHIVLINHWVSSDDKQSEVNIVQLDQGQLGMPSREYFLKGRSDKTLLTYESFAVNVAKTMGAEEDVAKKDIADMIDFEIELANITIPEDRRRDTEAMYHRFTLNELYENLTDQIDWFKYLTTMYSSVNITIDEKENVVVYSPQYMKDLGQLIQKTVKRTLANYIIWHMIMNRINNLSQKYLDLRREFNKAMLGTEQERARWRGCVNYVNSNLGMAVGRMFVQEHFEERAKSSAIAMIRSIQESFRELLQEVTWMADETKKVAQEKADAIREKIAYPDYIVNDTALNKDYEGINSDPKRYFENVLNILHVTVTNNLKQLRLPVDRNRWATAPAIVNAFYIATKNVIIFPAGILHPPFYHENYPMSLNFGGIGMVIGHEITHGFDDKGRQFDKNGNLKLWWSPKDVEEFKNKAQCIVDQYSNYTIEEVGLNINGRQTQGENIADNGGLKQAFRAYRKWVEKHGPDPDLPGLNLTHDQLFFLNFAQIWCGTSRPESYVQALRASKHSPGKIRVIGSVSNSIDFAKAFDCSPGSKMNPINKCNVW